MQSRQRALEGGSVRERLGRRLGSVAAEVLRDYLEAAGEGAGESFREEKRPPFKSLKQHVPGGRPASFLVL